MTRQIPMTSEEQNIPKTSPPFPTSIAPTANLTLMWVGFYFSIFLGVAICMYIFTVYVIIIQVNPIKSYEIPIKIDDVPIFSH